MIEGFGIQLVVEDQEEENMEIPLKTGWSHQKILVQKGLAFSLRTPHCAIAGMAWGAF